MFPRVTIDYYLGNRRECEAAIRPAPWEPLASLLVIGPLQPRVGNPLNSDMRLAEMGAQKVERSLPVDSMRSIKIFDGRAVRDA